MKRSKLETHVDILATLSSAGPLKITHLMYKTNINCTILKGYVDYLLKQGLVEERILSKQKIGYSVTKRGITVLKHFEELKSVLPMTEEEQSQN